jgi:hypothetical protein
VLILSTIPQKLSSKIAPFTIIFITLNILLSLPVHACKPSPGSKPASIEARIQQTPYVFDGTVTKVHQDKLTIRVKRYFKGKGSQNIVLSGFNQTSCQNIINKTGDRYLFFAQPQNKNNWNAVYDGAFGSVREWNKNTEAELKRLGLIKS